MKRFLAMTVSFSLGIVMCACAGSKADTKKDSAGGEKTEPDVSANDNGGVSSAKTVGISLPDNAAGHWRKDGSDLKKQFEEAGFKVDLRYSDSDGSRQSADVQEMISGNVALLLIAPVDNDTLPQVLDKAKTAEIPVIAYDDLIMDSDAVSYFVSFDDYAVGKLQGEVVRDRLQLDSSAGPFNVEFVEGDPAEQSARLIFDGAFDVLKPYIDDGKLVIPSGKNAFEQVATPFWFTDTARANLKETLDSYYSEGTILDAVVCSDDPVALGAVRAIASDYAGSNKPIITGHGGGIENLRNIVDGTQTITVYKNPADEAYVAFEVGKAVLSGQTPDGGFVSKLSVKVEQNTDSFDNNKKKVPSYLLTPSVINKDNLQLLVDTGLYEWDSENKYLLSTDKE